MFILGLIFALISGISLITNTLVLVSFSASGPLRRAQFYVISSTAAVDILASIFWTSFSSIAAFSESWILPQEVCKLQGYFMSFCALVNFHSLLFLAFERFLRMRKPSKHGEIFQGLVPIIMIGGIWVFDAAVAIYPIIGWSEFAYFTSLYECVADFHLSETQTNFYHTIMVFIPLFGIIICYCLVVFKVRNSKTLSPDGFVILEKNLSARDDSYSERLKTAHVKFQNMIQKKREAKTEQQVHFAESDVDPTDVTTSVASIDTHVGPTDVTMQNKSKKFYSLDNLESSLNRTYALVITCYMCCWIPYVVCLYIWTYSWRTEITRDLVLAIVCLTHCSTVVKPLVYITTCSFIRNHVVKFLPNADDSDDT